MHAVRVRLVRHHPVIVIALLVFLIGFPALDSPAGAQSPCDGLVTPRLQPGDQARVTTTYGLSLKNEPRTGAAGAVERRLLAYDTVATVIDGYTCNLGYVWWQLQLPDGTVGWAAEGGAASSPVNVIESDYYLAPVTVGLHVVRPSADRMRIANYFVTPDGRAEPRAGFTVPPLAATPAEAWQPVEIERLRVLLDDATANCPDRLRGTVFEGLDADAALELPLPQTEYDLYPAPDGEQVVIVQHQHLRVPRCDTVIPARVGISMVRVLDSGGARDLFPFPQHGSVPESFDVYDQTEPGEWRVYLDQVVWSPQGQHIAFVAAYRDTCGAFGACVRFHTYVANLDSGELYQLGEGRHVGWTSGGAGINLFRLVFNEAGQRTAQLYTMRPNGFDRQQIWLPGGAVYVSDEQAPLGFPWNASGTRVLVANAGEGEVMLFELANHDFTARVVVPDKMPQPNRLAVDLVQGESAYLWTTIRGDFALQDVDTGRWDALTSTLATTGVAPAAVRPFANGTHALIEMVDGSAYVLDIAADRLTPVAFGASSDATES